MSAGEVGVRCPACDATIPPGQRFCGRCGTRLAPACPACGAENPPANRFCGHCGAGLNASEPATPGTESQPSVPSEERRWVTVLFADLAGFTALAERMDPEDVKH